MGIESGGGGEEGGIAAVAECCLAVTGEHMCCQGVERGPVWDAAKGRDDETWWQGEMLGCC